MAFRARKKIFVLTIISITLCFLYPGQIPPSRGKRDASVERRTNELNQTGKTKYHPVQTQATSIEVKPKKFFVTNHYDYKNALLKLAPPDQRILKEALRYPKFQQSIMFYKKHDILYCPIPKVCNTWFKIMFCRSNEEKNVTMFHNPKVNYQMHTLACMRTAYENVYEAQIPEKLARIDGHNLLLVRDPFIRFVSAYMFACHSDPYGPKKHWRTCLGCKLNDFHCVANSGTQNFWDMRMGKQSLATEDTFLNHAFPQAWYCHAVEKREQYTIMRFDRTEKFKQEARKLLSTWNLPDHIVNSGWGPNGSYPFMGLITPHTYGSKRQQSFIDAIFQDPSLANAIFLTYFLDYVTFNFPLPREVLAMCKKAEKLERRDLSVCLMVLAEEWPVYEHALSAI